MKAVAAKSAFRYDSLSHGSLVGRDRPDRANHNYTSGWPGVPASLDHTEGRKPQHSPANEWDAVLSAKESLSVVELHRMEWCEKEVAITDEIQHDGILSQLQNSWPSTTQSASALRSSPCLYKRSYLLMAGTGWAPQSLGVCLAVFLYVRPHSNSQRHSLMKKGLCRKVTEGSPQLETLKQPYLS